MGRQEGGMTETQVVNRDGMKRAFCAVNSDCWDMPYRSSRQ